MCCAGPSLVRDDVVWGKPLLVTKPHSLEEGLQVLGVELCVEKRGHHSGFLDSCSQRGQPNGGGEREEEREGGKGGRAGTEGGREGRREEERERGKEKPYQAMSSVIMKSTKVQTLGTI